MFTWVFGKGRGGAYSAIALSSALFVLGALLLANPMWARSMQEARQPSWVFGALLLGMAVLAGSNALTAVKKGSARVGTEWVAKTTHPDLYRLFLAADVIAVAGFGALGIALLI